MDWPGLRFSFLRRLIKRWPAEEGAGARAEDSVEAERRAVLAGLREERITSPNKEGQETGGRVVLPPATLAEEQ